MSESELREYIDRYRRLANSGPVDEFSSDSLLIRRDIMKAIIAHIDALEEEKRERRRKA